MKHPGKILQNYINRSEITVEELAENIEANPSYLHAIIAGQSWIDAELAYKLGYLYDTGTKFWLNLQTDYDAGTIKEKLKEWKPKTIYIKGIYPF